MNRIQPNTNNEANMIIIPARLESTRLQNKLLLELGGLPLIVRVANIARELDSCIVACDSDEIMRSCNKHNIECMLTSKNHTSGTDRCAEAAQKLGLDDDEVVINLQGDEPFIEPHVIEKLSQSMRGAIDSALAPESELDSAQESAHTRDSHKQDSSADFARRAKDSTKEIFMASCYKKITPQAAQDQNLVKVVLDSQNLALYFSRLPIPYNRGGVEAQYRGHLGIYAFSKKTLLDFCNLSHSPLEHIEKLEQLRALWHGKNVLMIEVESDSIGIDTIEDYNNALERMKG